MSTAVVQAVNSGSETYGLFSGNDTYLEKEYLDLIPNQYPFDCSKLVEQLSVDESIDLYCDRLNELIKILS